jgi:hypothetical protein
MTDRRTLIEFYKKVHPFGPGWQSIRAEAGVSDAEAAADAQNENIPLALVGWLAGSVMIWSSLFMVGNFLYGRMEYALGLLMVFAVSAVAVIRVVQRLLR